MKTKHTKSRLNWQSKIFLKLVRSSGMVSSVIGVEELDWLLEEGSKKGVPR